MKDIYISGFADEISSSFDEQLKTVRELGMQYISLRSADKKGIADFTVEEVKTDLLPRLQAAGCWRFQPRQSHWQGQDR